MSDWERWQATAELSFQAKMSKVKYASWRFIPKKRRFTRCSDLLHFHLGNNT